jgi:branched-chain amino acid transport system ATP-binding protein
MPAAADGAARSVPMHSAPTHSPLMHVDNVDMRFGGIVALDDVSFEVGRRQVCGLIGPNGSGKTTMFNCISGFYRFSRGDIVFDGTSITGLARHRMIGLGIGRTFQNVALFASMTVRENMLVGAHHLGHSGFIANALRLGASRPEEAAARRRGAEILALLELEDVADTVVAALPFGTRKRVELARALIAQPKLLLLDEPAGGLTHGEVDELGALILRLRATFDMSILLVEHHMSLVMSVSDKVVALEFGRKIADGTPDEVRAEPEVIRAYLGEGDDGHA